MYSFNVCHNVYFDEDHMKILDLNAAFLLK